MKRAKPRQLRIKSKDNRPGNKKAASTLVLAAFPAFKGRIQAAPYSRQKFAFLPRIHSDAYAVNGPLWSSPARAALPGWELH